jgi:hypothetical protein
MKAKILILILTGVLILVMMNSCTKASASMFGPSAAEQEAKQRLSTIETQLTYQRHSKENWAGVAGALALGCVLLLIIGTALGAQTRRNHHHAAI